MIWAGLVALLLAILCLVATFFGLRAAFDAIATTSSTPLPSDLADGINRALLPSYAAAPLALLGIVLLILGLIRRQPVIEP
jgi:hypothetical protein